MRATPLVDASAIPAAGAGLVSDGLGESRVEHLASRLDRPDAPPGQQVLQLFVDEFDALAIRRRVRPGIGLARAFEDELADLVDAAPAPESGEICEQCTLVTGELFAPVLREASVSLTRLGAEVCVLAVRNALFGGNVSVAGLLTGHDIVSAVRHSALPEPFLVPDVVLNADGLTLDDVVAGDLAALSGKDVRMVPCDAAGLADALRHLKQRA